MGTYQGYTQRNFAVQIGRRELEELAYLTYQMRFGEWHILPVKHILGVHEFKKKTMLRVSKSEHDGYTRYSIHHKNKFGDSIHEITVDFDKPTGNMIHA